MTTEQRFMLQELLDTDEILVSDDHKLDDWTKGFIHDLDDTLKRHPNYQLSQKQHDKLLEKWKEYCDD